MTPQSKPDQSSGTYEWRVVASPAIVTGIDDDGQRTVAAPNAKDVHHRLVKVFTIAQVGTVGHLRYVSNFPRWGRLEFEIGSVETDETRLGREEES